MKQILIILFLINAYLLGAQSTQNWKLKVSDNVFKNFEKSSEVEYLLQLKDKPDLSLSKKINSKIEKTKYVFNRLKSFAEKNQKDIIRFCQSNHIKYKPFYIVNAILVKSDYVTMKKLAQMDKVNFIEANPSVKVARVPLDRTIEGRSPNSIEWGVEKINADDVWNMGYTGTGVVVGGQDTGYRWTHEALKSKYRGWNGSTSDHNYNWHDAIDSIDSHNSGDNPCGLSIKVPCDDQGHGTHTMGTMIGSSGSNEIGVAPDAKWIGCRNMERGWGKPTTYIECFEWFLAPTDTNDLNADPLKAPDVINNSWYCPESEGCNSSNYATMETAVNNLRNAGIVVVVSAGNSGPNCSTINTPPNFFSSSFDVGATNSADTIANFSSRGPTAGYGSSILKPNISAPGVNVRSSTYDSDNSYGNKSGTSMAGPHVAGAVALLLDAFPEFKGNPDTIEHILQNSAVYLDTDQSCGGIDGTEIPNNTYGYGRIDILAAINYVNSLPLRIISFNAEELNNKSIKLNWSIKSKNTDNIDIQRSMDGITWNTLTTVKYSENDEYYDKSPIVGTNYYRLKLISADGDFEFTKIESVNISSGMEVMAYPTLVRQGGNLNINIDSANDKTVEFRLMNVVGRTLYSKRIKITSKQFSATIHINQNKFTSGVYFLTIKTNDNFEWKEKFLVIK